MNLREFICFNFLLPLLPFMLKLSSSPLELLVSPAECMQIVYSQWKNNRCTNERKHVGSLLAQDVQWNAHVETYKKTPEGDAFRVLMNECNALAHMSSRCSSRT